MWQQINLATQPDKLDSCKAFELPVNVVPSGNIWWIWGIKKLFFKKKYIANVINLVFKNKIRLPLPLGF